MILTVLKLQYSQVNFYPISGSYCCTNFHYILIPRYYTLFWNADCDPVILQEV